MNAYAYYIIKAFRWGRKASGLKEIVGASGNGCPCSFVIFGGFDHERVISPHDYICKAFSLLLS
jgi:hypothetical protein